MTTLCDGFGEAHPNASEPEACSALGEEARAASVDHGEGSSLLTEAVTIVAVVAPLFAIGSKLTEGVLAAFGPDVWAILSRVPGGASFLANSPRIATLLSHVGVRAAVGAATTATTEIAVTTAAASTTGASAATGSTGALQMVSGAIGTVLSVLGGALMTPFMVLRSETGGPVA